MSSPTYEFDITGQNPANLVPAEPHIVSEINSQTERLIIPVHAPFYVQNFGLVHIDDVGERKPLLENVDFYFIMPYLGAMYGTAKAVYGGIVLTSEFAVGRIEATYQCLGRPWSADPNMVRQALIEGSYNPRVVDWDVVTNVQQTFPPMDHGHTMEDMTRITDVLAVIRELTEAIANGQHVAELSARFATWTAQKNPGGLTLADLGITPDMLKGSATNQEVASMLPVDKFVTLEQMVEYFLMPEVDLTPLQNQINNLANSMGNLTAVDLGLGNVANLPPMTEADMQETSGLDKYVLHKHLVSILSQYGKAQPHMTAASLYLSQS